MKDLPLDADRPPLALRARPSAPGRRPRRRRSDPGHADSGYRGSASGACVAPSLAPLRRPPTRGPAPPGRSAARAAGATRGAARSAAGFLRARPAGRSRRAGDRRRPRSTRALSAHDSAALSGGAQSRGDRASRRQARGYGPLASAAWARALARGAHAPPRSRLVRLVSFCSRRSPAGAARFFRRPRALRRPWPRPLSPGAR